MIRPPLIELIGLAKTPSTIGPLLYHFAEMEREISVELSYEEIKAALPPLGLKLIVILRH